MLQTISFGRAAWEQGSAVILGEMKLIWQQPSQAGNINGRDYAGATLVLSRHEMAERERERANQRDRLNGQYMVREKKNAVV